MQKLLQRKWAREEDIVIVYGLPRQVLRSLAADDEITSISTKRNGAKQGSRLIDVASVVKFFERQEYREKISIIQARRSDALKSKAKSKPKSKSKTDGH